MRPSRSVVVATILAATTTAHAEERRVPEEYPTIQAAIDAAVDGDVVSVGAGTYGSIDLKSKAISVHGRGAARATVIDGGGTSRAVLASGISKGTVELRHLTITRGRVTATEGATGAGIQAIGTNLTLSDVIIRDCEISHTSSGFQKSLGAGVFVSDGTLSAHGCSFIANQVTSANVGNINSQGVAGGAAVGATGSTVSFVESTFESNSSVSTSIGTSWHNVFSFGGAVHLDDCMSTVDSCVFADNSCSATNTSSGVAAALSGGAAIFAQASSLRLNDCEFLRNRASASSVTTYSASYNNALGGAVWFRITDEDLDVVASTFIENTCAASLVRPGVSGGGALYVENAQSTIDTSMFVRNEVLDGPQGGQMIGGAVCVANGGVAVSQSQVCANTAPQAGIRVDSASSTIAIAESTCISNLEDCSLCEPPCVGDLAADGVVDSTDAAILLSNWGSDGSGYLGVDLNGDGLVGAEDLALLLDAWGHCSK